MEYCLGYFILSGIISFLYLYIIERRYELEEGDTFLILYITALCWPIILLIELTVFIYKLFKNFKQ